MAAARLKEARASNKRPTRVDDMMCGACWGGGLPSGAVAQALMVIDIAVGSCFTDGLGLNTFWHTVFVASPARPPG